MSLQGNTLASSYIKSKMRGLETTSNTTMTVCRVERVNSKTMTVDAYVPSEATVVYGIPICFPTSGKNCGSYFMPVRGTWHILMVSNSMRPYLFVSPGTQMSEDREPILPGENTIQSEGQAFIRQDVAGNQFIKNKKTSGLSVLNDDVVSLISSGIKKFNLASDLVEGISLKNSEKHKNFLNRGDEFRTISRQIYYNKSENPKVYSINEILSPTGSFIFLPIMEEILADASILVEKLLGAGANPGVVDILEKLREDISYEKNLTKEEFEGKISEVEDYLNSNFKFSDKGLRIQLDIGNSYDGDIKNHHDIIDIENEDYEKVNRDEVNKNICFKLSLTDISTSAKKFEFLIDEDGEWDITEY